MSLTQSKPKFLLYTLGEIQFMSQITEDSVKYKIPPMTSLYSPVITPTDTLDNKNELNKFF
jgi:hypothetical protein